MNAVEILNKVISGGVIFTGIVTVIAALINILPSKQAARNVAREIDNKKSLNDRDTEISERDKAQSGREAALAERDHWREQWYALRDAVVMQQAECRGRGLQCKQDFAPIVLKPFAPKKGE